MSNSRYDIEYLTKTTQVLESFKSNSYQPFAEIQDGKIADIGCGSGDDIVRLAKLFVNKDIQLVGVDYQSEMIEAGISQSAKLPNVSFLLGDAGSLPFSDSELAGLRNERLIQHLSDPEVAFSEFYRVLRSDSPIVIAETDWSSLSFYNGKTEIISKLRNYFETRNVQNGRAAVSLIGYLSAAGFRDISIDVFPMTSYSLSQCILMIRLDHVLVSMRNEGIITEQEEAEFFNSLQVADEGGYFVSTLNLVIVKAKK